ncbi:hypothetical protein L249_5961 [Ophiocordyceps polyrhachis-furcata BCC 54312]|uniref:Uncharacterized protein n=1 Tax=Ophiocordyceps polyrhachis-furcata BCC 54312 TaxID=1330021 RepID=A0A367LIB8_9HYPO|nr:hypothetical protein L249_5961 [Ophiocordyceps polyrhachis-furcata BCC 54312]
MGIVIAARELGKTSEKWNRIRLFAAVEIIMSNQGVDHVIEKKKKNHVMVVFNEVEADNELEVGGLEEDFNVMDQPDDLTLRYDRYRYSAPIAVTAALCRD